MTFHQSLPFIIIIMARVSGFEFAGRLAPGAFRGEWQTFGLPVVIVAFLSRFLGCCWTVSDSAHTQTHKLLPLGQSGAATRNLRGKHNAAAGRHVCN